MKAIELEAEVDENNEIHIKLPKQHRGERARVIVVLESEQGVAAKAPRHRPSPRLAFRGARLDGDDIEPAFTEEEWGALYR